ncbi:hypothetical protein LTR99_005694 [Exophiala xenobiotica]|uniref:EDC4-like protein pdc1 beta-propeller domain-containing protein n=1 Tax=Vermiconidia calcicola TaxID=1690605 RepID=A0AAV9QE86_9PEZI|nr:hypothetical protein LTR92_006415 [Exophiala xenobiotica]KAK5540320.1 hypothetical protein LTR23_006417 [Chaetothyriales sp. CCFEE 6169]KAK5541232.1 hypothetical protein LTR25_003009 [Vermiconidia calcicola]KAK5270310.1 hypothetical protein LTR96_004811 [Exophiala xenobiotica]KAK5302737.1 hypothetical protein LTR99_005694 [Exophiala xenobiotica]
MSTNDLQALFANLKPKPRDSPAPSQASNRPGSSGLASQSASAQPLPSTPPPPLSSVGNGRAQATMASQGGPAPSVTAQSLLNLLNFGPSTQQSANIDATTYPTPNDERGNGVKTAEKRGITAEAPSLSASDLVAKFMSPPPAGSRTASKSPFNLEDQGGGGDQPSSSANRDASQDALLKLLKKAHSGNGALGRQVSAEQARSHLSGAEAQKAEHPTAINVDLPVRAFGASPAVEAPPEQNGSKSENKTLFTYVNPFEALNASRSQTPRASTPVTAANPRDVPVQSIESSNDRLWEGTSPVATPEQVARRKILTPRLPSAGRQGTISREASVSAPEKERKSENGATAAEKSFFDSAKLVPETFDTAPLDKAAPEPSNDAQPGEALGADHSAEQAPNGGDEWEDADESPTKESGDRVVPVYNFPIKPFVSITLQLGEGSDVSIRDDGVMEISRLKKDFDQLDRSLAAATAKYITYALVKNGGMRIIRQDDGSDRQVFKNSHDRVFNVAFCTTSPNGPPSDDQAILGTGVSGAVYYATIQKDGNDLFEKNELESESLIFPPYPPADENTAGGVLKTRAKRSSRHPEVFAIGRGKAIHLIWPATALSSRYGIDEASRRVDVDKFFQERAFQISTGKAGKDFTFSEDDSLLVSLDKTGRLRFWDIRKLIEESNTTAAHVAGMTVDTPLLSLSTASPAEKSWPTSVLFVDKARPYVKGGALRYVLVGLRQNHTLQLWDIALGKAVQEINFPHENETDGICSVNYHPSSGIIIVGHPTRNSLFFIHLSAPRYTLSSSYSQATYVERIAMKDPELPKPESTACMSGIREISFTGRGQLRSVELLPVYRAADEKKTIDDKAPLFELYVVHSKGVTCLSITKEDLGWNADSKVVHPVDAAKEGLIDLKELRLGSVIEETEPIKSPAEEVQQPTKSSKKKLAKKAEAATERTEPSSNEVQSTPKAAPEISAIPEPQAEPAASEGPATKQSKKNKKKATLAAESSAPGKPPSRTSSPTKKSSTAAEVFPEPNPAPIEENVSKQPATAPADLASAQTDAVSAGISGDWLDKELKKLEHGVAGELRKELNVLYQSIHNDRIVQDESAVARQQAVLGLVSTTLTNTTEKALSRIVAAQMHQSMVPAVTSATVQAVSSEVGVAVQKSLNALVPQELGAQLPAAINTALQSPQMSRTIADTISQKISKQLETQLADVLQKQVVPAFKTLAVSTAEKAASEVEVRLRKDIQQLEADRRHDMGRLEKLGQVLQATTETLQQMSNAQVAFQGQILKDRRQLALIGEGSTPSASRQVSTARMTPSPQGFGRHVVPRQKSKEEVELDEITDLMNDGHYEEGSIKWLQSSQPVELFDKLFIQYTPEYLATDVSPLIAFSIAVTIGNSLTTNTARRLEWVLAAFNAVDLTDPEIADLAQHAPALLTSLIQKLEGLYMTIAERDPRDPALQLMPLVSRKAKDMKASLLGAVGYRRASQTM